MMYLLDTNVISELRKAKSGRADKNVIKWATDKDANELYLSVITILEIETGILQIARKDSGQADMLRDWFKNHVIPAFSNKILPIDTTVALKCAELHVPDPRSDRDALIAATGLVHSMTIVTRNVAGFHATGVDIINPWLP